MDVRRDRVETEAGACGVTRSSATVRVCHGAKVSLRKMSKRIAFTMLHRVDWWHTIDLTPRQARQLADKLHAMVDAIKEAQRAGAGGK